MTHASLHRSSLLRAAPLGAALLATALPALAALDLPRPSPKASVTQTIGLTEVSITYSRPGVKGRVIWGELVPWDAVWRTGANEATIITFGDDVTVEGQKLAKGKYSLHTIPGRTEWTIIFNKVADQWGSYSYDATQDALRIKVTPAAAEFTEWMTFSFPALALASGEVALSWEKLQVAFTVETDTVGKSMANIDKAVADLKSDRWRVPYRAADFALQSKKLDQAITWVNESIAAEATYLNQNLKARILAEQGKNAEAIATMDKAIATAREAKLEESIWKPAEKLIAGWKAK